MIDAVRKVLFVVPLLAVGSCEFAASQSVSPAPRSGLPAASATQTEAPARANAQNSAGVARHADVQYSNGLLTVTAKDSSLNGILHQISQQTGMTISGSVRDDRVFGTYGPDRPSAVLTTLLDGSGSNMLLVNNASNEPAHLVLSPRLGGPTPPSQFAADRQQDQDADENEGAAPRFGARGSLPQALPAARPNTQPGGNLNPSISAPVSNNSDSQAVVFPPVNATTTPATATTSSDVTQEAPGGVKTPEQIFEQLQRMRQQQEQTQPPENNTQ